MDKYLALYKEFYFREIDRKNYLNNAISIPILIITGIISINTYIFTQKLNSDILLFGEIISSINLIVILRSIFFIAKSFSNFFSAHTYRELADMGKIRLYQKDLFVEQSRQIDAEILFEDYVISEFSKCAQHNFKINKVRTEDLAKSKKYLLGSVFLTIIFSITYIFSIIQKI